MKIVIVYGSTMGNCSDAATKIAESLEGSILIEVSKFDFSTVSGYDLILLGTSTWGFGELQDDWEEHINDLENADLAGKKVALFGTGDQYGYADTFVDGVGILYEAVKAAGGEVSGFTSTDGYSFSESRAVIDGKFVGLMLDEDNENDKSEERIKQWVDVLNA